MQAVPIQIGTQEGYGLKSYGEIRNFSLELFHDLTCSIAILSSQTVWESTEALAEISISPKGPVTRCNFSCNLQRNSTLKRC